MIDLSARQVRTCLLATLYVLAFLGGVHAALTSQSGGVQLGLSALFASTVAMWCIADSKVVGKPMLISFQWLMFFTWPVSVPAYLMWTRRLRGLALAVLRCAVAPDPLQCDLLRDPLSGLRARVLPGGRLMIPGRAGFRRRRGRAKMGP